MNRFRKAWLALTDQLQPEVVTKETILTRAVFVPAGDGVVTVYVAQSKSYQRGSEAYWRERMEWIRRKSEYEVGQELRHSPYNTYRYSPHPGEEPKEPVAPEWSGRAYLTCAQAFAEIGEDADLTPHKAIVANGKAYLLTNMAERELAPKPKVAKGKR